MSNDHLNYRPDIDGLRAIAVLSVVGFHVFPTLIKGGFIGVDIFFVISGFLISSIILNNLTNNNFSIFKFYSRRIKRIFPALLITLLACLIVGWFILFPHEFAQLGKHVLGGAGFFSNFTFWSEAGYFDNLAETKPLLHLWSLGIEEQYYIIWPLLLYLIWKKPRLIPFVLLIIFMVSLTLNISVVHRDLVAAFYSPQTRFWELVAGSLLAYFIFKKQVPAAVPVSMPREQDTEHSLTRSVANVKKQAALHKNCLKSGKALSESPNEKYYILENVSSLVGFILICISLLFINKTKIFPGWWAILPNLGTLLIILAGPKAWLNKTLLSHRILIWIGLISFPLYLWHWPLLSFAFILKGEHIGINAGLMIILISIMLAWATYFFVEKPIRLNQNKFIVYLLILIMLAIGLMGFYCKSKDGFLNRPFWKNFDEVNAQFVGPDWQYIKNDLCLNRYPFEEAKDYQWWFCMINKNKKPTVILLGNSFANQLYPGLLHSKLFSNETILSIGTCDAATVGKTPLVDLVADPTMPCAGDRPLHQEKFINDIIKQNVGSLKYAIIAGLYGASEEYLTRLKSRIDFLEENHIKVIVFLPHLLFNKKDVKSCIRPFGSSSECISDLKERNSLIPFNQAVIKTISKTNPNVVFFDPNDLFCDSKKCSRIDTNGLPFYRDQIHISEYGSIKLINLFEKQSAKNLSEKIIS
ncbi:acyltransferase family protein [Legionella anisa]|uniref:Acyltransferase n=1 Tax=Legionella anisa TaxID=28082 RepID=A0AAX0WVA2_9GAMM|nr:acyltransferase family protein [Legionella anisa]AWN74169.1 acyltransferase [Legionella anisa]KTC71453.1 O-antigen acetylase [Legionella anisa]MBN5935195.1 acyltransferase [Legionella anisa]MCW8425802.1 acyltransferase [Legionella anisa]MCW8448767.1 acyltransferase [Legionella anisa]